MMHMTNGICDFSDRQPLEHFILMIILFSELRSIKGCGVYIETTLLSNNASLGIFPTAFLSVDHYL